MSGLVKALGKLCRATGQALDGLGSSLQGSLAYKETRELAAASAATWTQGHPAAPR